MIALFLLSSALAMPFEEFKIKFAKKFRDAADEALHREVYERNLRSIEEHNQLYNEGRVLWSQGVNQFTDMTQAEFKQYNGYKKKKPTEKDKDQPCPPAQLDLSQPLPDTVDYRQANPAVLSPVKDQGACGSCWAFATAETVEAAVALATKQAPPVLSPQEVVSCTDNPDKCGGAGGCQGATAELGFQGVKENGLCSNQAWPYTASDGKCNNPCKAIVNITGCARLKTNNETELMYAVATVGPIAISVDASTWNTYRSGIFTSCLNEKYYDIDHAVQLVGYGEEKGNKYWIVRNSWGKTWGEGGYIRVARLAADDPKACKKDVKPGDGVACAGETDPITVCGECGLWYDSCYPVGAYYLDSYVKQPEKHEAPHHRPGQPATPNMLTVDEA